MIALVVFLTMMLYQLVYIILQCAVSSPPARPLNQGRWVGVAAGEPGGDGVGVGDGGVLAAPRPPPLPLQPGQVLLREPLTPNRKAVLWRLSSLWLAGGAELILSLRNQSRSPYYKIGEEEEPKANISLQDYAVLHAAIAPSLDQFLISLPP